MSYITLKDEYYTPGIFGAGRLGLRYDPKTGDYELKQKSALGYDIGIGLAIFYKNGSWTSDAIQDPNLFTNKDPTKPTQLARELSLDMNKKVNAAYIQLGGQTKGNLINSSALPANQNNMGVDNRFPGTVPPVNIPGITTPAGQGNLFDPGLNVTAQFGSTKTPSNPILKYPKDLLENNQDTFRIAKYKFKSPNENIFSGGQNIRDILTKGVSRNTTLEQLIQTVVLPMPNVVTDSNNVLWGDDSLNPLATAATAESINRPDLGIATLAASAAGQAAGVPGASQIPVIAMLMRLAATGASNDENVQAQLKAAMHSFYLKKSGFEVSPESMLSRGFGVVPNSNLQLLFNNVTLRQFGFSYKMSPRNSEEAADVRKIIRFFKEGMAAKKIQGTGGSFATSGSLFLGAPDIFKLEYKSGNKSIKGVNKFKVCALQSFTVNYTAENQWESYEDANAPGQPISMIMQMQFKEIEPIYDTDYGKTNFGLDQASIDSEDDVGF